MRAVIVAAGSVLAGIGIAFGCSSSTQPVGEDVHDADAVAETAPRPDRYIPSDGAQPDPDPPPGLPDGWELDRSYWNQCGFYVPKTKEKLPPPLSWEPCPANAEPAGADCKLMTVTWEGAESTAQPGFSYSGSVEPDGRVILGASRRVKPGFVVRSFAEADGPVRSAVLQTRTNLCSLGPSSTYAGRYANVIYEVGLETGGGLLASELDSLRPRITVHLPEKFAHSVYAAPFAILDLSAGAFHRWSWQDASPQPDLWSSAQDNGLQQGIPVFAGDAMFWPMSNSLYHKVKVYTPTGGVRDFLSVGLVFDRGFGDLGTDGVDLVWIDAQGRTSQTSNAPFTTLTIMTAPFTTDPAKLVPKRLRTELGPEFDGPTFVVGCGYAARSNGTHIRIVRLSDGQSWILPTANGAPISWQNPLAITCTELFAWVASGNGSAGPRTARVRLDSLGPGMPPD